MRLLLLVAALMLMSSVPTFAADESTDSSASVSVPAAPGVDIRSIIASVAQRTHKKFLIDPRVRASVSLVGTAPGDVTYPLLLTILAVHNFAVFEQEGVIIVAPDANERYFPSSTVAPDEIRVPDAEVVTTIVAVKNIRATELVSVLRPLVSNAAAIVGLSDRNAVVIVDRAANVRRIVTLIRELDKLPPRAE